MSANDTSTPMIGTNGTHGVLNGRGRFGSRTRRIQTPAQTIVNANSVPMLVNSASVDTGSDAASVATQIPTTMVEMYGVRNRGWILLAHFQRSPSVDMVKKMRDRPSRHHEYG